MLTTQQAQLSTEQTVEVVKAVPQRAADADKPVHVQVFKCERAVTKDDDLQGQFHLNDVPSAPCGARQIEATFDIDANESMNVYKDAHHNRGGNRSCEAHPTRPGADAHHGANRGRASPTDLLMIRRSPQAHS